MSFFQVSEILSRRGRTWTGGMLFLCLGLMVQAQGGAFPPEGEFDAFIILGQSNAVGQGELEDPESSDPSVLMLGNDYDFKVAYEPVDDGNGQVDLISRDASVHPEADRGHTWILRAAKGVTFHRRNQVMLIPCQKGGTRMNQWMPGPDRLDRSSLFGSANHRRLLAAPQGLKGIWYYGHESNSEPPFNASYEMDWSMLLGEFRRDYGPVPIIYAQLAGTTDQAPGYAGLADLLLAAADKQRVMETKYGGATALKNHHMVVTFDLPLVDYIHLNRLAVNTLADRFALATRQYIYREKINGTGPRLKRIRHPRKDRSRISVKFTSKINQGFNNYDNQFRVYADGIEVAIRRVERDRDPRAVLIILEEAAAGEVTVSYGGLPLPNPAVGLPNVVKDLDGLPTPTFYRQPVSG